ncbi:hypothetical protein ACFY0A_39365 [Streptomyces sp. NPDC001698]
MTLCLPAPLLVPGENTVTRLELERFGERIELRGEPELGGAEECAETFSA